MRESFRTQTGGSIEDMEVVEVKRKLDETKKNTEPQESTRPAEEMKEIGRAHV